MSEYNSCTLCPRNCKINRYKQKGYCLCTNKIRIALAKPFFYEEPPISGINGSGAIFFSGCNLKCCFCQNNEISSKNIGKVISIKRLAEIMLELQDKKVHNINLVTPTMYIPSIIKAIKLAKKQGLKIPIVYNSSGYEKKETIKLLNGYIDIYLPDFKYYDDEYAQKYSKTKNYLINAKESLEEMLKQVGPCKFDEQGIIQKGVIVRHLMLPTLKEDTKEILKYLYTTYQDNIYLSIMNQYTPNNNVPFQELEKPIKDNDYEEIINYALDLGINQAFCQTGGTVSESFIPSFNFEGVKKTVN